MTQLGQLYEKEKIEYANQKVRENTKELAKSLMDEGDDIIKIMKVTGLTESELLLLLLWNLIFNIVYIHLFQTFVCIFYITRKLF